MKLINDNQTDFGTSKEGMKQKRDMDDQKDNSEKQAHFYWNL